MTETFLSSLAGLVSASAITAVALRYLLGREMASKKTKAKASDKVEVTVQLTPEQYDLVRIWAERSDLSIQDYALRTLIESVPAVEQTAAKDAKLLETALDRAFGHLDATEGTYVAPGVFPLPPARKPIPGVLTEAERTHPMQRVVKTQTMALPTVPPGPHPCMHLSDRIPGHLRGQCQGTCSHRDQEGRICYWTPTTASNCPLFELKAAHRVAGRRP